MKLVFFDTETTGLDDNAEVIQLAGFVMNDSFKVIDAFNVFCSTTEFISDGAKAVHGLTEAIVEKFSNGNTLEDWLGCPKLNWLLTDEDIVFLAYNSVFDKRLINQTLNKHGYSTVDFGRETPCIPKTNSKGRYNMCMMKSSKLLLNSPRPVKLGVAAERLLKDNEELLQKKYRVICSKLNVPIYGNNLHDALYDSFLMMMVFYENRVRLCR